MNTTTRFCSLCVGTGKPLSGLPCICGGAGTEDAELQGFRTALYDAHLKLEIMRAAPLAELIWASPREVLNIVQANDIGCHVITVTSDLLKKTHIFGKDLGQYSLETVQMFHRDAAAAGFTL